MIQTPKNPLLPSIGFVWLMLCLGATIIFVSWGLHFNVKMTVQDVLKSAQENARQGNEKNALAAYNQAAEIFLESRVPDKKNTFDALMQANRIAPNNPKTIALFKELFHTMTIDEMNEYLPQTAGSLLSQIFTPSSPILLNQYADGWSMGKKAEILIFRQQAGKIHLQFIYHGLPSSFFPVSITGKGEKDSHTITLTSPKDQEMVILVQPGINRIQLNASKDFSPQEYKWEDTPRRLGFHFEITKQE